LKLKKQKVVIIISALSLLVLGGIIVLSGFFETKAPEITFSPEPSGFLPASKDFTISFKERGRGLKEIEVFIEQDNKRYSVFRRCKDSLSQLTKEKQNLYNQVINISVVPKRLLLHDGPAFFGASAWDHSLWHWGRGNYTESRYGVIIDTNPPRLEVLTRSHNIRQGGSALIIYRCDEELLNHGVKTAELLYPGYYWRGFYLCLFAYHKSTSDGISYRLVGEDKAGNKAEGGFYYYLLSQRFKKDKIGISDNFLRVKMPEFWQIYPELEGKYLETFVKVNTELRQKNHKEIRQICRVSHSTPLWHGGFIRPKGARQAGFGDERTYCYKDEVIGHSVHEGIDIASIIHAPVYAANHGLVVYKDYLGIYGNTVIIDHGLGLFSLYGHLSSFQVEEGEQVKQGDIIGYTGTTGLAGGDHLHFSMLVNGEFVNPVEWWDSMWVENNITQKMLETGLMK
jgi:hypothetical protein